MQQSDCHQCFFARLPQIGYYAGVFGNVLILLWVGIFKFTPTEAQAIKPLVENHPLMGWSYKLCSEQAVSNIIGVMEIITALALVAGFFHRLIRKIAAFACIIIFLTTLSFLFTTPNSFKIVDGVPVTNFFILKDIALLALGMIYLQPPPKCTELSS